jgi:arsenate reductase
MLSNSRNIPAGLRLQSIAKYLERVGDHATNIAEMVVYKVKAADIRHTSGAQQPVRPRGILFLCIENAARSQMAEALARSMFPPDIKIFSAGSNPASAIDPMAVQVMKESGLDISMNRPKRISDVPLEEIDTIVTLCSEDVRIGLPGEARRSSWVLPDPSKISGSDEDRLAAFRSIRDQMQARLSHLADYFGHLK